MRTLALAAVLLAILAAPAQAGHRAVDRGLIVRVRPAAIVLQQLDGTRTRIRVSPATVITLDGRLVALRRLRRGDVAFVVHVGRRPASLIRAFSR